VEVPMMLSFATVPLMSTAQTIEKLINDTEDVNKKTMVNPYVSFIMLFYSS
jgi:hypothetical protein